MAPLANAFTVTPAPASSLSNVSPTEGRQGEMLLLTLRGVNTHFTTDSPAPTLTLGSNISVSGLTAVKVRTYGVGRLSS